MIDVNVWNFIALVGIMLVFAIVCGIAIGTRDRDVMCSTGLIVVTLFLTAAMYLNGYRALVFHRDDIAAVRVVGQDYPKTTAGQ